MLLGLVLTLEHNNYYERCESKIGHIGYGDVEHFRPKAGWIQNIEQLHEPGYYWLAYEWENLLLSGQRCNQHHKKNFFPLIKPSDRALSHHADASDEQPVFIHAANEEQKVLSLLKKKFR